MNVAPNGFAKIGFHVVLLPFRLCKYDWISIGFALKLDLGWQSERGWCFRWLLGVSMIFWVGVGEKIYSPMHRDSLCNDSESILNISESILSLFFFPRIWHVCTLETIATASLHRICAVRRVPIAGQCVLPPAVISAFYFRYAFISAVWNAVRIRCMKLAYWQTFTCVLCIVLKLAVKCSCISEYFYEIDVNSQLCFQSRTKHLICRIRSVH